MRIRIRLTPSARRGGVDGVMVSADGSGVLKTSVTQAPEGGKANAALVKLLAQEWRVAKSVIQVIQGRTSRNKVLGVSGDTAALRKTIARWARSRGLV